MTDRALSETAMLASLRDIDLPSWAAGGIWADLAATAGVAGLAALAVAGLLRMVSLRRGRAPVASLQDRLVQLRAGPQDERRLALLHLLREHAPHRYEAIKGALYRRDGGIDTDMLEAEVARIV